MKWFLNQHHIRLPTVRHKAQTEKYIYKKPTLFRPHSDAKSLNFYPTAHFYSPFEKNGEFWLSHIAAHLQARSKAIHTTKGFQKSSNLQTHKIGVRCTFCALLPPVKQGASHRRMVFFFICKLTQIIMVIVILLINLAPQTSQRTDRLQL